MSPNARLLVIGSTALSDRVARALPRATRASSDTLLGGLWSVGHEAFDGIIIGLPLDQKTTRGLRSLRKVAPDARIVISCPPGAEPAARSALESGADEYVLEPLDGDELASALRITTPPPQTAPANRLPPADELAGLGDCLRSLNDGPQATLDRLVDALRKAFETTGVLIELDDLTALAGDVQQPVLEETILRGEAPAGRLALGSREHGSYASRDAIRLADYARLIEAMVGQAREQAHWQELALRDDLTGLHNRRFYDRQLNELIQQAAEQRHRLSVVLIDIDDFKTYNDRYGHDTGDALLREVARLLTRCSREHDIVARYGGDEFAVIMWDAEKPRVPGSQHPSEARALADRFRSAIGEHAFKCLGPDAPGPVTISGGIACFPWDGKTRTEIVGAADEALLSAKRTGKNRIELAKPAVTGDAPKPADETDES